MACVRLTLVVGVVRRLPVECIAGRLGGCLVGETSQSGYYTAIVGVVLEQRVR